MLFNFATLVPGVAMSGDGAGREMGQVSAFTVNGQRPNSNNMTIDGVANIDTGDNGGNMATTSIDSVAEFKVLTNAYQAEYGRAVGGQIQVVTKSGSNDFHGSGYWYGRRSDWNATSWMNHRNNTPVAKSSRDDKGYTVGGPVYIPASSTPTSRSCSSSGARSSRAARTRSARASRACRRRLERTGDFSQSLDSGGNPYPYIRDYTTGLPCSASDTRGCFQDGGVVGKIPANRLYGLGSQHAEDLPDGQRQLRRRATTSAARCRTTSPRREDLIRVDYQMTDKWRVTGRYMKTKQDEMQAYGTTWAGNGSRPAADAGVPPAPRQELDGQHAGHPEQHDVPRGQHRQREERADLRPPGGQLVPLGDRPVAASRCSTRTRSSRDYIPLLNFRGGRTGNAGHVRHRQRAVRQLEPRPTT